MGSPLVNGALRKVLVLRFQIQRSEGLLILGQVLAKHLPKRFGLLRAEKDRPVIADRDLFRAIARSEAEDELEIPYADAHLDAVGVCLAVIVALNDIHLRLLRSCRTHATRLRCQSPGAVATRPSSGSDAAIER